MAKYRLLAADLDGTLLDDTYSVKPELLAILQQAKRKGIDLVVATGRLYPSALPIVKDLGVNLPVIASNGAVVMNPATGEVITHLSLNRDLAIQALRLTGGGSAQRFVNVLDKFYTDASAENTKKYSQALRIDFERRIPLEDAVTDNPTMVVIRDREEEIARLTETLRNHFGTSVYLANSKPFFIDINHPGATKGAALQELCRRMKIDPGEVVAIGDGWNDLEMFKVAGQGAAVANAPDLLKEKADYVCANHSYQGVIEVVERMISGEYLTR